MPIKPFICCIILVKVNSQTNISVIFLDDMLAFKFTNLSQEFACVNLVTPCLKATRRFIVTVRVSLFHSDATVRLLDNLFVQPLKTSVYLSI